MVYPTEKYLFELVNICTSVRNGIWDDLGELPISVDNLDENMQVDDSVNRIVSL